MLKKNSKNLAQRPIMATKVKHNIERLISSFILKNTARSDLQDAILYSIGGKFLRSQLVYLVGKELSINQNTLDYIAISIELLHSYTLIHDDLPSMDNDNFRRNKPSVHRQFNNATAILAGDTLQSLSFLALAKAPKATTEMIQLLANSSKILCEGQNLDLLQQANTIEEHFKLIQCKTSTLMATCLKLPAMISRSKETCDQLYKAGLHLGTGFQLQDDFKDQKNDPNSITKILSTSELHDLIDLEFEQSMDLLKSTLPNAKHTLSFFKKIKERTLNECKKHC